MSSWVRRRLRCGFMFLLVAPASSLLPISRIAVRSVVPPRAAVPWPGRCAAAGTAVGIPGRSCGRAPATTKPPSQATRPAWKAAVNRSSLVPPAGGTVWPSTSLPGSSGAPSCAGRFGLVAWRLRRCQHNTPALSPPNWTARRWIRCWPGSRPGARVCAPTAVVPSVGQCQPKCARCCVNKNGVKRDVRNASSANKSGWNRGSMPNGSGSSVRLNRCRARDRIVDRFSDLGAWSLVNGHRLPDS